MSWWKQGGFDKDFDAEIKNPTAGIRFWMPEKTEKTIIFITPEPEIFVYEHNFRIGKSWKNWATCLSMIGKKCPLCDAGIPRYECAPFTVIDTSEYVDRKNKSHSNEKKLLIAKSVTWEKLLRQGKKRKETGGSLAGAVYTVVRYEGKKSANSGDEFEYNENISLADFAKEAKVDVSEFNVKELMKPDPELVNAYVARLNVSVEDKQVNY